MFLLPSLILLPLGLLWLWQEGWLLAWMLLAAALAALAYLPAVWQRWRRRPGTTTATATANATATASATETPDAEPTFATEPADPQWAPRDLAAWDEVLVLAKAAGPEIVSNRESALAAARNTIERVAQHYRPEQKDPIWSFTLPELLLLTERVSMRLRSVLLEHVPAAHVLEAAHLWRLWEFKPMATSSLRIARHLHQVWRVSRLVNPMSAVLAEARQRLMDATVNEATSYLRREGGRIWIEEVGRAAIDLYSGRLRIDPERLHAYAAEQTSGPKGIESLLPGPVRLLVAGRINAGKSALVNALLGESAAGVAATRLTRKAQHYRLQGSHLAEALMIDTPGLGSPDELQRLVQHAWESDVLLWVLAADSRASDLDRQALDAIRQRFAADPRRSLIPILVVVSRIDCLPPVALGSPPFPLDTPGADNKLETIRDTLTAAAQRLQVSPDNVIGVTLEPLEQAYNLDAIRDWLKQQHPNIQKTRAQRLQLELPTQDWRRVFTQTLGAGKLLKKRLWGR